MIYIHKGAEPQELIDWKIVNANPNLSYHDLKNPEKNILRNSLLKEQGYICCFCGCGLGTCDLHGIVVQGIIPKGTAHNIRNAHVIPQSVDPSLSLDYKNICASCNSKIHGERHCDLAQENKVLPVTPLQIDCASYFSFKLDGTIEPNKSKESNEQVDAQETIDILNLNSNYLKSQRANAIKQLKMIIESASEEDKKNRINELSKKNSKGAYAPYFFVPLIWLGQRHLFLA